MKSDRPLSRAKPSLLKVHNGAVGASSSKIRWTSLLLCCLFLVIVVIFELFEVRRLWAQSVSNTAQNIDSESHPKLILHARNIELARLLSTHKGSILDRTRSRVNHTAAPFFGDLDHDPRTPWLCPSLRNEYPMVPRLWDTLTRQQFDVCEDHKQQGQPKFLFIDNSCEKMGLFATLSCWAQWTQMAMQLGRRTLVITGEWRGFESAHRVCLEQHPRFHCHFLPFHGCDSAERAFHFATEDRFLDLNFDEMRLWYYLSLKNRQIRSKSFFPYHSRLFNQMRDCLDRGNGTSESTNSSTRDSVTFLQCSDFRFLSLFRRLEKERSVNTNAILEETWVKSGLDQSVYVSTLKEYHTLGAKALDERSQQFPIVWVRRMTGPYHKMDKKLWHNEMDPWVSDNFGKGVPLLENGGHTGDDAGSNEFEKGLLTDVSFGQYASLWYSLFLRPQPWLRNNIVRNLGFLNDKYHLNQLDPSQTLAMPIRWGDKCSNNPRAGKVGVPEMYCFTPEHFVDLLLFIRKSKVIPELRNVIITSDSPSVIADMKEMIPRIPDISDLNLIWNDLDVMQENGIMAAGKTTEENPSVVMESMLTTVRLQLFARYICWCWWSSWSRSIWYVSQALECSKGESRSIGIQLPPPHIGGGKLSKEEESQMKYRVYFEERERSLVRRWSQSNQIKLGRFNDFPFRNLTISMGHSVPIFGRTRHP